MADEVYPVVKTTVGAVKGKKEDDVIGGHYYNFLNIPYAQPPIGELRFEAPVPVKPWEGVRDCTEDGPVAPALNPFTKEGIPGCSEDCLFLNVYTKQNPLKTTAPKAVMVYIYGGGFDCGSSTKSTYGPDFLVQHDIVLVSINYRVGALGFLSLETQECPGNNGLKDQVEALRWIQKNISCFGGDPNNVTIFGESAGAASVHYLTLSKTTKGLFHKAIAQSGSALNSWAYSSFPRKMALALVKKLGFEGQDDKALIRFLRGVSWEDIVTNSYRLLDEVDGTRYGEDLLQFPFTPTAEPEENNPNAFITEHPRHLLEKGHYCDIPIIVGCTSAEGLSALPVSGALPNWTEDSDYVGAVPRYLGVSPSSPLALQIGKTLKEFFFKNGVTGPELVNILSDHNFVHGVYKLARCQADNKKRQSPTYFYVFTYEGQRNMKRLFPEMASYKGTTHGDDVYYFFTGKFAPILPDAPLVPEDVQFIKKVTKLWTDFARTGELLASWTPVSKNKQNFEFLEIGAEFKMDNDFPLDRMELWDDIFKTVDENNAA